MGEYYQKEAAHAFDSDAKEVVVALLRLRVRCVKNLTQLIFGRREAKGRPTKSHGGGRFTVPVKACR